MAEALVGSAILSGAFNVLFDRLAAKEVLDFLRPKEAINKLLEKLKVLLWSAGELLDDAEEKRIYNRRVENWHNELKDVVYKAGELTDKIETEALRLKMEGSQSATTSSLSEKLKGLKDFFSNPLSSFDNYVKDELEKILFSLELLLSQKKALGLEPAGKSNYSDVSERSRPTPFVGQSDFCGREGIKETIMQSLRSAEDGSDKVSVIPVIGAGGLGKTTLVQIIYDHPEVKQLFGEVRAWITVSIEFDLRTITKTIIEKIAHTSPIKGNEDHRELLEKMRDALTGKKFLLVLDDVWSEDRGKWNTLKSWFQSAESGSKIIVTTRSRKVASIMAPNQQHHFLQELPEKDCLKLFAHTVFGDDEEDPDLQEIGKKIVRKCKGNPLSVITVARILCAERHMEEWEKILESSLWELLQKDNKGIIPSLWLSYLYLPPGIKPCFAYCSIFPKDHPFEKEVVVRLWMAEGFLKNGAGKTMEEVGKEYFEELISRSLFQRSRELYKETFIMHDLVHDLAMEVSGEFCFCLEGEKNLRDLSCKTRYLSCNMEIQDVTNSEGLSKARRLHSFVGLRRQFSRIPLNRELGILKVLAEVSLQGACLRVLSLSHYDEIDPLRDSLGKLKQLRYLDLSNSDVRELPDSVCTLYNLQTLLLAGCGNLTQLPESIGNLKELRYLDLSYSGFSKLPDSIGNLKELRYLDLSYSDVSKLPDSIGNLKELRYLDLSYSGVSELPDSIGTLHNLRTLLLLGCLNLTLLPIHQGNLINLHRLNIGYSPKLEYLGNCRYGSLKDLKIVNCEALKWIPLDCFPKLNTLDLKKLECLVELTGESADELKELSIEDCPKLEFLGNCRYGSLKYLKIVKCEALKRIPLDYFPKLNTLDLKKLECLVELTGESADELKELSIEECPKLESLGNCRYGSLKDLKIQNCEALKSIPVDYFPKLTKLTMRFCQNFESFRFAEEPPLVLETLVLAGLPKFVSFLEGGFPTPNLKHFHIFNCKNLRSLPQQMHRLLRISIAICGEIESWPEGGLPSNLESLAIWRCKKLAAQVMHWDLKLTCLKSFLIDGCGEELLDSFPPEGLLPTSLTSLEIHNFRRLKTLNIHAFQNLKQLRVYRCEELPCLPEESLPNSLSYLDIVGCPLLERR